MYDLSELKAFVTVVRAGSLTAGSRELGQPKSTLSRKLRHLEVAVGQPLLSRHSRRIEPNEAGRVFYGYSMSILELVEEGREALDGLRDTVRGTLRLSSHEAFVRGWFAGTVRGFLEQHPELRVTVSTRAEPPSDAAEDLCLWLGDPGASSQRQEPLGCLSQGGYASPDYLRRHGSPQAPADLSAHHWVAGAASACDCDLFSRPTSAASASIPGLHAGPRSGGLAVAAECLCSIAWNTSCQHLTQGPESW